MHRQSTHAARRVTVTVEGLRPLKPVYAGAGRVPRASRLRYTYGRIESFVVVVPTSGFGSAMSIDQQINCQSTVEAEAGGHEIFEVALTRDESGKECERLGSVFT